MRPKAPASDAFVRPTVLILAGTILVPLANYLIHVYVGSTRGPSNRVSLAPESVALGWRILASSSFGTLCGLAFDKIALRHIGGTGIPLTKTLQGSRTTAALVGLLFAAPLTLNRAIASRPDLEVSSGNPVRTGIMFVAPAACTVLAVFVLHNALDSYSGSFLSKLKIALIVALAILPGLAYSLNRAAVLLPALAIIFGLPKRGLALSLVARAGLAAVALIGAGYLSNARLADNPHYIAPENGLWDTFQVYAAAPQFVASGAELSAHRANLTTLSASIVSPVPIVGKLGREASGTTVYNQELYGSGGFRDQLLFANAELYAVGGHALVIATFAAAALALRRVERAALRSTSTTDTYVYALSGFCLAMLPVSSILSVSQGLVAFAAPALVVGRAFEQPSPPVVRLRHPPTVRSTP